MQFRVDVHWCLILWLFVPFKKKKLITPWRNNNNVEKLLKNCKKNKCCININFFIANEFIDFLEFIVIKKKNFHVWKVFGKFWKMNVTLRILDIFSYQDSISHARIFRAIELTAARLVSIFFSKTIFWKT